MTLCGLAWGVGGCPLLPPALLPTFIHISRLYLNLGSVQKGQVMRGAIPQFPVAPGTVEEGCGFGC